MTLGDFLSAAKVGDKPITVNLYDKDDLLLITFNLPGYPNLDDSLEGSLVRLWSMSNLYTINVYLSE